MRTGGWRFTLRSHAAAALIVAPDLRKCGASGSAGVCQGCSRWLVAGADQRPGVSAGPLRVQPCRQIPTGAGGVNSWGQPAEQEGNAWLPETHYILLEWEKPRLDYLSLGAPGGTRSVRKAALRQQAQGVKGTLLWPAPQAGVRRLNSAPCPADRRWVLTGFRLPGSDIEAAAWVGNQTLGEKLTVSVVVAGAGSLPRPPAPAWASRGLTPLREGGECRCGGPLRA